MYARRGRMPGRARRQCRGRAVLPVRGFAVLHCRGEASCLGAVLVPALHHPRPCLHARRFSRKRRPRTARRSCSRSTFRSSARATAMCARASPADAGAADTFRRSLQAMVRPEWAYDVGLRGKPHSLGNFARVASGKATINDFTKWIGANFDPAITWKDLDFIREDVGRAAHHQGRVGCRGCAARGPNPRRERYRRLQSWRAGNLTVSCRVRPRCPRSRMRSATS